MISATGPARRHEQEGAMHKMCACEADLCASFEHGKQSHRQGGLHPRQEGLGLGKLWGVTVTQLQGRGSTPNQ